MLPEKRLPISPITVVRIHYVKEGCEEQFETEMKKYAREFGAVPGNLGVNIFRPGKHPDGVYRIVYKFASQEELARWHESPSYKQWMAAEQALVIAPPATRTLTGLETWFTLPGQEVVKAPKKYRQAIVTWIGALPVVIVITLLTNPFLKSQPMMVQKIAFVSLLVPLLTWVVMPLLTRVFARFLYEGEDVSPKPGREPVR